MSVSRDKKVVYRSVSQSVQQRMAAIASQVEQGRMAAALNQQPDGTWTDAQLAGWMEGRNG